MDTKNLGVLTAPPRSTDYIAGVQSPINVTRMVQDWSIYLPAAESQRNKVTDFLDCVTMSAIHTLESQLNYLLATNQLSDEAINFFKSYRYIVDGKFSLSVRFNAKINGTNTISPLKPEKGQYLNVAGDSLRNFGFIPNALWPMTDTMTDTLYYCDVPIGLFSLAKKVLWFLDIKYQWVSKDNFRALLLSAPIQVATEVCAGWDSGETVPRCSGQPLQHSTMIYGIDEIDRWLDLDHYPPFKQPLAFDYEFPLNMQYMVTVKPLTLRMGMHGANVLQLQKDLNKLGFLIKEDSDFGPKTEIQVRSFQNKTGLVGDGIAGAKTLAKLKELITPRSLLDAMILVESNGNDFAEGDKTLPDHAYGCLQIRQGVCDAVNSHFDTSFKSIDCYGNRAVSLSIWDKYWQVYPLFTSDEEKAKAWNGGPGWKQIYFKTNKTPDEIKYCNNLDIYWSKVSKLII